MKLKTNKQFVIKALNKQPEYSWQECEKFFINYVLILRLPGILQRLNALSFTGKMVYFNGAKNMCDFDSLNSISKEIHVVVL